MMRGAMEIYQLELFLAVVHAQSMTKAARERGLSPGAMSQQLHKLAGEIGTQLFVKAGRGLQLTPEGEHLAERAKHLVLEMEDLKRSFGGDAEHDTSPFHLATGITTLIHGLGRPLRALRRRYPRAQLRVAVANTEEMVEGRGDLDRKGGRRVEADHRRVIRANAAAATDSP